MIVCFTLCVLHSGNRIILIDVASHARNEFSVQDYKERRRFETLVASLERGEFNVDYLSSAVQVRQSHGFHVDRK